MTSIVDPCAVRVIHHSINYIVCSYYHVHRVHWFMISVQVKYKPKHSCYQAMGIHVRPLSIFNFIAGTVLRRQNQTCKIDPSTEGSKLFIIMIMAYIHHICIQIRQNELTKTFMMISNYKKPLFSMVYNYTHILALWGLKKQISTLQAFGQSEAPHALQQRPSALSVQGQCNSFVYILLWFIRI